MYCVILYNSSLAPFVKPPYGLSNLLQNYYTSRGIITNLLQCVKQIPLYHRKSGRKFRFFSLKKPPKSGKTTVSGCFPALTSLCDYSYYFTLIKPVYLLPRMCFRSQNCFLLHSRIQTLLHFPLRNSHWMLPQTHSLMKHFLTHSHRLLPR